MNLQCIRKVFRPFQVIHILLCFRLILKWIQCIVFLINLQYNTSQWQSKNKFLECFENVLRNKSHVDDVSDNFASSFINITVFSSQHVSGPTHNRGHLFFILGLNIDSLLREDLLITDHSCILYYLSFNVDSLTCRHIISSRILNHLSAERFSDTFHFNTDMHSDDDPLVQSFNEPCAATLDKIPPIKARSAPLIKSTKPALLRDTVGEWNAYGKPPDYTSTIFT